MNEWRPPWEYRSSHDIKGRAIAYLDWPDAYRCRTVIAPGPEMAALDETLSGREYPLFDPLPEVARGLPVIDFGAHVGSAAVYFEEMLQPSMLLCYEPSPKAFAYLLKNTGDQAQCIQAAIGSTAGVAKYAERSPIFTSTCGGKQIDGDIQQTRVATAKSAFDRIAGEIGVLKIDIEGGELNALMSLGTSQLKRCRIVYLEYHHEALRRMIDPIMVDFQLVHAHTQDDAWWGQGTLGYIRRDLNVSLEEFNNAQRNESTQGL